MSDFFETNVGLAHDEMRNPRRAVVKDLIFDAALRLNRRAAQIDRTARTLSRQRILVVGVEVPSRGSALSSIVARLADSRHEVVISTVSMQAKGKFENIDDAIMVALEPLETFDWLIITDDDVELPANFTDRAVAAATLADLSIAQPAHKFRSYTSYDMTRRGLGSLVRRTNFVEIGPLTLVRKNAFSALVPFPVSRWAWGLDLLWSHLSVQNGWNMGVIDALPIRHLRPVGEFYRHDDAINEAKSFLEKYGIVTPRAELLTRGHEFFQRAR